MVGGRGTIVLPPVLGSRQHHGVASNTKPRSQITPANIGCATRDHSYASHTLLKNSVAAVVHYAQEHDGAAACPGKPTAKLSCRSQRTGRTRSCTKTRKTATFIAAASGQLQRLVVQQQSAAHSRYCSRRRAQACLVPTLSIASR